MIFLHLQYTQTNKHPSTQTVNVISITDRKPHPVHRQKVNAVTRRGLCLWRLRTGPSVPHLHDYMHVAAGFEEVRLSGTVVCEDVVVLYSHTVIMLGFINISQFGTFQFLLENQTTNLIGEISLKSKLSKFSALCVSVCTLGNSSP